MESLQLIASIAMIAFAIGLIVVRVILNSGRPKPKPPEPAPTDPIAEDLASALPTLRETRAELQQLLWLAGYYRPGALNEYLAIRATLVIGVLLATAMIALFLDASLTPLVAVYGGIAALLAFSLPRVLLSAQASGRGRRLVRGLPVALDVLGLCLTAGQNLVVALAETSRELKTSCPDLAEELHIVHQQASLHSLEQAMQQWSSRIELPEVRTVALLLLQSDRLGTDIVTTLLELADSQRVHQKQKAEGAANRANFWMLLPTLFCLWVASAIVLVGPAYLEFWDYRKDQMKTLMGNMRGTVEQSNLVQQQPSQAQGE
jgi:tight adherence protein C